MNIAHLSLFTCISLLCLHVCALETVHVHSFSVSFFCIQFAFLHSICIAVHLHILFATLIASTHSHHTHTQRHLMKIACAIETRRDNTR